MTNDNRTPIIGQYAKIIKKHTRDDGKIYTIIGEIVYVENENVLMRLPPVDGYGKYGKFALSEVEILDLPKKKNRDDIVSGLQTKLKIAEKELIEKLESIPHNYYDGIHIDLKRIDDIACEIEKLQFAIDAICEIGKYS